MLCTERAVVLFLVLIDGSWMHQAISNSAFSSWYMVDEASSLARDKQRYARTRRWPVDVRAAPEGASRQVFLLASGPS